MIKSIGGNDDASHIFYIQDGELYVSESDGKNPVQLSRNLIAEEDVDEEEAMYIYAQLYRFTKYSEKTNMVVFPDKIGDDDGISLYSLKLDSKANKTEPTKIAGDVDDGESAIYFNDDESRLFYKNEEDSLYSYDFNEKAKIANDVSSFYVVPEKDTIVYMTYDNELYSMKISTSESTKIAADVSVQSITDTTIVYTTESTINVLLNGTDNLKIADFDSENEGVNVQDVDSDGKVLYYIYRDSDDDDDEGTPFSNFIEDDLYESDSKIVEPDRYDEKYWKETEEGFFGAYVTEYTDEYYTLKEQYEQKSARDSFRDRISDLKITKTMYSVYYFDSKNTTCITEQAANVNGIVYKIYDFDAVGKIKMSELATLNLEDGSTYSEPQDYSDISASDFRGYIYDRMNDTAVKYIFNNGKSIKVEGEFGDLSGLEKDSNSTAAYFMYDETLYKANINNVDTCTPEALYSDVDRFILSESGDIFSFRNGDERSFDLYVNDKKIDSDVFIPLSFNSADDFAYITDYTVRDGNIEMPTFTVKYYNGKESSVIASDVSSAVAFGEKDVFYVCDSSTSTGSGTLKHYTGKKDTPVFAEDVYLVWQEGSSALLAYYDY